MQPIESQSIGNLSWDQRGLVCCAGGFFMAISLRVVGIFYRNTITLPNGSGSVKDLLDAAVANPGDGVKFSYTNVQLGSLNSLSYFSATFDNPFISPISGLPYPAGTYELQEVLTTRPSYTVWQYYIMDAENRFLNDGLGAVPYDQAQVADGQKVVWRLLNILAPATGQVPRLVKALS